MALYFYISPDLQVETEGLNDDGRSMGVILHINKKKVRGILEFVFLATRVNQPPDEQKLSIRLAFNGLACAPIDLSEMAQLVQLVILKYEGIQQIIGTAYLNGYLEGPF